MRWLWLPTSLFLFSFWLVLVSSITIDDQDGDPTSGNTIVYSPPGAWILGAIGNCPNCASPSPDLAYLNTFHGSLFNPGNSKKQQPPQQPPTATVTFFGTSVSVICILANSLTNPNGASSMTFDMDGIQVGSFPYTPTGSSEFQPNKTVFSASNLSLRNHTLTIQNGLAGEGSSLIILDSVIYSADVDLFTSTAMTSSTASTTPSSSSVSSIQTAKRSNSAAIAGGVLAALAVILLLGLVFLYLRHRRNRHRSNVPLTTTISPIGRMRSLWSAHGAAARPPPDMAPVPFPSPAFRPPTSPAPAPRPPHPTPAPPQSRFSRISFNPNLLVGRFHRPPPLASTPERPSAPPSPAPRSGNPLLLEAPRTPVPLVQPHDVMASIQEWQQRTLEETANEPPIHPLDMSEVDLSTHYDESSSGAAPQPPPPRSPQPPQRRFTVMNN
ncbi:hypothetical protein B0H11DRAFT_2280753 [Mycena galericulata]|nr:hypothetical protein B0H11DRAFT_2280753 [Mycena galericulata]